jgi:hypothetical protein
MRPSTVESAIPNTPQWKTKRNSVFRARLITLDQIPAHIVERVSWCAFTRESGMTDQNVVKADPATSTVP